MTRIIKTIAVAVGLLSLSGVLGQALPAQADPPSHARGYWKNKDKDKDKGVFARWHDQNNRRDDHRDDDRNRRDDRGRNDDRRNNDDRDRNRNYGGRDNDRDRSNWSRDRNRDTDRDGVRDVADRYPTDRRRH